MNNAYRKLCAVVAFAVAACTVTTAQDVPNPRPLKLEEYEKAKTFTIKNLDEDTYAKFENTYILDRYELRNPTLSLATTA